MAEHRHRHRDRRPGAPHPASHRATSRGPSRASRGPSLQGRLLARIADQRAEEWGPCDYTTQAREIAREARAIAENAHRLLRTATRPTGGAKSQENPAPF
jgi:hypothetical protein